MEFVTDPGTVAALYGPVDPAHLRRRREPRLAAAHSAFLAAATMVVIATVDPGGLTCSPRGGRAGTVGLCRDERTIWVPDAAIGQGHQTVRNIMDDPRIGLVFFAPGRQDVLRVQGTARLTVDPEALAAFPGAPLLTGATDDDPPARSVLVVDVQEVRLSGRGPLTRAGAIGGVVSSG